MIDVEKLKADLAAAKDSGHSAVAMLKTIREEAYLLRTSHGGGGQQAMDDLIAAIDAISVVLVPPPPPPAH
jgi:hypothetical protein